MIFSRKCLSRDPTHSAALGQYLHRFWDEILHCRECTYVVPQNALECKNRVKNLLPNPLDFSTFFFVIYFVIWVLCFFCYTYICILSLSIFIILILLYFVIKNFIKFIYLFFYIIIFLYFYLFNMITQAKIRYVILEDRVLLYHLSFIRFLRL